MAKFKMVINKEKFDKEVWNTNADFSQKDYNKWLNNAVTTLKGIYNDYDGDENIYILGDIINILSNTEIKTDNNWSLNAK